MECKYAKATFRFTEFFTDSIQELIADGEISTEDEIKGYIMDCLLEDVGDWLSHSPNEAEIKKHLSFDIELIP